MKSKIILCALLVSHSVWAGKIYVNQAGYDTDLAKTAVVEGAASLANTSFVLKSGTTTAFTGTLSAAQGVTGWTTQSFFVADFSALTTPGTYTLQVTENSTTVTSPSINIAAKALCTATLGKVLDYFKNDRANDADVWSADAAVPYYGGRSGTRNVQGGWYDASGDISKYLTHLSYAKYLNPQQTPMTVWALAFAKERIPSLIASAGKTAQIQQEALWGADFLMRMLDPAGYFYATVFDGWTGYTTNRYIAAFEGSAGTMTANYQAAMREGGGMSIAALARVSAWGVNGDSTSAQYLAAAKRAYALLKSNQTVGGACAYCDSLTENIIDDYTGLLAASELFAASADTTYRNDARRRAAHLIGRLTSSGYFNSDANGTRPYWHASDAGLPLVALTRFLEVDPSSSATTVDAIRLHLSYLIGVTKKVANPFGYARQTFRTGTSIIDGFFIPHDNETGYWWQGENARLGSLAAAAFYAGRKVYADQTSPRGVPDSISRYAVSQLDWILGRNPKNICFFQGVGDTNSPAYSSSNVHAGHLVGGIVNGITGANTDGSGLSWQTPSSFGSGQEWNSWRWVEQWLPHSTWFLMALAAMEDETPSTPVIVQPRDSRLASGAAALESARVEGGNLEVQLHVAASRDVSVRLLALDGRQLLMSTINEGTRMASFPLPASAHGVLLLQVGLETRRLFR